jgi:hypothetical protein
MHNRLIPLVMVFAIAACDHPNKVKTTAQNGYAQIGPLKMYYEVHGEGGMPLVLIHRWEAPPSRATGAGSSTPLRATAR